MNYKSLMIAVVATSAMGMTAANAGNTTNTALASALGGVVGAAVGNKIGRYYWCNNRFSDWWWCGCRSQQQINVTVMARLSVVL